MPARKDLDVYASQSLMTDPGVLAPLLHGTPTSLRELRQLNAGLVVHYRADRPLDLGIGRERLREIDTRYAETMLRRLTELQDGPLTEPRDPVRRLVGCCRDFTVLFLASARARGVPARARVGFARYFVPDAWLDHEVAEVWDQGQRRWRLVDAQLSDPYADPSDDSSIDPLDVPRDRFLIAGQAWRLCRAGKVDPDTFMVGPDMDIDGLRGWPYIQHNLVHDLAALCKHEMLLWDAWGLADQQSGDERDLDLLDRVAALTSLEDPPLDELQALAATDPRLPVPATVTSYDPLGGPPRTVAVEAVARSHYADR
ncbi:MAG: transglutaminase-like domain-containing protein [Solirubrobacteraceae bacterium]